MISRGNILKQGVIAILVVFLLSACASTGPHPAYAQSQSDIPIIVLGDDSENVKRSSDIFRRVMSQLQDQMSRYGFAIVDEGMIAADLGFKIPNRRSADDLKQVVALVNESSDMRHHARALVIFKIKVFKEDLGFATKAQVRIAGETYDTASRTFLRSWETQRKTFAAPAECNNTCLTEIAGDHARDLAASLGDTLRKQLSHLTRGGAARVSGTSAINEGKLVPGLKTTYSFEFHNFKKTELLALKGIMETKFPLYIGPPGDIQGDSAVLRFAYITKAPRNKMYKWVHQLLDEEGFDIDHSVKVMVSGTKYVIDKIIDAPATPPMNRRRFY